MKANEWMVQTYLTNLGIRTSEALPPARTRDYKSLTHYTGCRRTGMESPDLGGNAWFVNVAPYFTQGDICVRQTLLSSKYFARCIIAALSFNIINLIYSSSWTYNLLKGLEVDKMKPLRFGWPPNDREDVVVDHSLFIL